MTINEHQFENREAMLAALYRVFVDDLEQALVQQSTATLLLSGGSTPVPLYRSLSAAKLDWSRVHVALVDERWVDAHNSSSNERLLRENLLIDHASDAHFTGMKNSATSPFDGAEECNADYFKLPSPYSICLLGMGPDGHTASLFPGAEGLTEAVAGKRHCAAIRAIRSGVTGDNLERMTMTPWSLLQSRKLILLITGNDKWDVYQKARDNPASSNLPVSLFLKQPEVLVEVYWSP
jgi:6-phosphogluconolactonase